MRDRRGVCSLIVAASVLGLAWGCGDGRPAATSSTEEATVSGTVTVKGKTATKGNVTFDPASYQRPVAARSAPIEKDGRYTIKTLVGHNAVRVSSPLLKGRDLDDLVLSYDVKSGEQTFDIKLPPE